MPRKTKRGLERLAAELPALDHPRLRTELCVRTDGSLCFGVGVVVPKRRRREAYLLLARFKDDFDALFRSQPLPPGTGTYDQARRHLHHVDTTPDATPPLAPLFAVPPS